MLIKEGLEREKFLEATDTQEKERKEKMKPLLHVWFDEQESNLVILRQVEDGREVFVEEVIIKIPRGTPFRFIHRGMPLSCLMSPELEPRPLSEDEWSQLGK